MIGHSAFVQGWKHDDSPANLARKIETAGESVASILLIKRMVSSPKLRGHVPTRSTRVASINLYCT